MMAFLGAAMTWLVGNGFKLVTLPALLIGMLHMGGNLLEKRRDELRREGAQACMTKVEMAALKSDIDRAKRAVNIAAAERSATETALEQVRARSRQLEDEINAYRNQPPQSAVPATSPAADDGSCLSQRMRELATGAGRAEGR